MPLTPTEIAQLEINIRLDPHERPAIKPNRSGFPQLEGTTTTELPQHIRQAVGEAFLIAHQSVHPNAYMHPEGGIWCQICFEKSVADHPSVQV